MVRFTRCCFVYLVNKKICVVSFFERFVLLACKVCFMGGKDCFYTLIEFVSTLCSTRFYGTARKNF